MLNNADVDEDWADLADAVFSDEDGDETSFADRVHIVLSWAVTTCQYGSHRPYIAVVLLKHWMSEASKQHTWSRSPTPQSILQDVLFDWLDKSPHAALEDNAFSVANLFGKLIPEGLFSYSTYLQRLLIRDEPGLSFASVSVQCPIPTPSC
jgi:mediator of RNA polymerase II transcription subunit 12, fungi type